MDSCLPNRNRPLCLPLESTWLLFLGPRRQPVTICDPHHEMATLAERGGGPEPRSTAFAHGWASGYHSSVRFKRPVAFSRKAISLRSPAFSSAYLSIS